MKKIDEKGQELRYWDFNAPVTIEAKNEDGSVFQKDTGKKGNWVRKEVPISVEVPETFAEASNLYSEDDLLEMVQNGIVSEAKRQGGIAPQGTFSKAMVSAVVKALKANPRFRSLQRTALNEAVMRHIGENAGIKAGFLEAFEELRTSGAVDNEEEEPEGNEPEKTE